MTQEEKQILLQDLCARLPYIVIIKPIDCGNAILKGIKDGDLLLFDIVHNEEYYKPWDIEYCKPYLRSMSSMTEEEYDDMFHQLYSAQEEFFRNCSNSDNIGKLIANDMVRYDWLNKNMFDYRGLIEKGLAIAVTKENNPYKD